MAAVSFASVRGALRESLRKKEFEQIESVRKKDVIGENFIAVVERPRAIALSGPPDGIAYTDNFISRAEEEALVKKLESEEWTQVSGRKVMKYENDVPIYLQTLARATNLPREADNCLCNFYECGQGIFQHTDGPAFLPIAAALSLGQDRLLYFYERLSTQDSNRNRPPVASVLLRRRSLIVFKDAAYQNYTHGLHDLSNPPHHPPPPCLNLSSMNLKLPDQGESLPTAVEEFLIHADSRTLATSSASDSRRRRDADEEESPATSFLETAVSADKHPQQPARAAVALRLPVEQRRISLTFRCSASPLPSPVLQGQ